MKKIVSILLAMLMLLTSIPAYASDSVVMPRYIHILYMGESFEIDTQTGVADVDADMMIESGSYCTISAKVQKETDTGWSTVVTYRANGGTSALIEEELTLSKGYLYKCTFTFTVYDENDFIIEQKAFSKEVDYT